MNPVARRMPLLSFSLFLSVGCGGSSLGTIDVSAEGGLDEIRPVSFEGIAVAEQLDTEGVSVAQVADEPFQRMGVLWDSPSMDPLFVRTSADNQVWSEWREVQRYFSEEGSHAGHVDVDGVAMHFQWRLGAAGGAPSYVRLEPIREIREEEGEPVPADYEQLESQDVAPTVEMGTDVAALEQGLIAGLIQPRSAWRARPPRCITRSPNPYRVTIHHTVTPTQDSMSPPARLRQIQAYHQKSQGWCDIGYNFVVARDGSLWRARGREVEGAHVYDNNAGNIGVAFLGNHMAVGATDRQLCRTAKLLRFFDSQEAGINLREAGEVKGHRQRATSGHGTSCPGDRLLQQVDDIVRLARSGC